MLLGQPLIQMEPFTLATRLIIGCQEAQQTLVEKMLYDRSVRICATDSNRGRLAFSLVITLAKNQY
jgi:hypothetical protein